MKVKEVIEKVSANEYWSLYEFEEEFNLEVIDTCVKPIDYHRWYEVSTNVYRCEDGFVGVSGVVQLFSEQMCYEDCLYKCTAEEYKQILAPKYVPLND
jgi:hypothetical protein